MRHRPVAVAFAILLTAGCSATREAAPGGGPNAEPGFGHVHGLGRDPVNGQVYAATHYGLFQVNPDGSTTRVADRHQDTMGFTIADAGVFYGSGHPGPREGGPPHLGLIRSTDRGQTWETLALRGEVDFHALTATGSTLYGWDSQSSTVLRSDDGGRLWRRGAQVAVADLSADPEAPTTVLATTETGLLESRDGGASFAPAVSRPPQPLLLIHHLTAEHGLAGVGPDGTVWTRTGDRWAQTGRLPGAPEAFATTTAKDYLAATSAGVYASTDAGRTWKLLAGAHQG